MGDNCAKTVITDVTASSGKKGIVHVIDRLIEAPPIMPEWVAMDENGNPIEKKKVEKKKEKKKEKKEEKKEEKKSSSSGGSSGGSRRTYGYYNPWWGKECPCARVLQGRASHCAYQISLFCEIKKKNSVEI